MRFYQHLRLSIDDRVARLQLAHPPLNVLTIAMMREVEAALSECMNRREIVAVTLEAAANSRAWCAGFAVEEHAEETIYQLLEAFHSIFRTLNLLAKPVVGIVDGAALGAGCELVAACDIVIASETARFGQPEIKLGIFPTVACAVLPRIIGERAARELILTGEIIDARRAYDLGLVTHIVAPDALHIKADEVLNRLRELSAPALESARRALDSSRGARFEDALTAIENLYLNDLMKTEDSREGTQAFLEQRKPVWKNR